MRKIIIFSAASLMIAAALPVYASSDDLSCGQHASGQKLSSKAIKAKATEMGYDVRKVESDDGCYEVYATGENGTRVEIYMNPVTGAVVKIKKRS